MAGFGRNGGGPGRPILGRRGPEPKSDAGAITLDGRGPLEPPCKVARTGLVVSIVRSGLQRNRDEVPGRRKRRSRRMRVDNLTAREIDVARLLSHGQALKEVGAELKISVQTASKHRTSIFTKMDVANQVELHQAFEDCWDLIEQAK